MTQPLSSLFQNIPDLFAAFACCQRIQAFLLATPRRDPRAPLQLSQEQFGQHVSSDTQHHSPMEKVPSNDPILSIQGGAFGWGDPSENMKVVLKDINLSIQEGGLHAITGPVASGKSTLLKAILGEATQVDGSVHFPECSVAYCDQTVWLQNITMRGNIIGYADFDDQWYSEVVNATALSQDMQSLPEGDQTVVGSNGMALSGGQKRRLVPDSLAQKCHFVSRTNSLPGDCARSICPQDTCCL